jgi:hypothetical protein
MVEIGDDLAYRRLVSYVGQRLGKRLDLLAERQRGRQWKRKLLPLQIGLDPPVLIVAPIQALDRLAAPGQVVEFSALDGLADLPVHPAFVGHDSIFSNARWSLTMSNFRPTRTFAHTNSGLTLEHPASVGNLLRVRSHDGHRTVWHAERMDPWSIGLIVLIIAGLAAIIFGAFWDRRRNKRRAAEMLAPPARPIPQFHPESPAPHYLSDLQARRRPEDAQLTDLTDADRQAITEQLADPHTVTVDAGYASKDFVTDSSSDWAVLERPAVLVCGDPIDSFRELISILERLILSKTPLVVVAPAIAPDVLATLEVNAIRQTMRLVAVICQEKDLSAVAAACHGMIIDRSDRQSGYLGPNDLGHCDRWISSARSSHLVVAAETTKESV